MDNPVAPVSILIKNSLRMSIVNINTKKVMVQEDIIVLGIRVSETTIEEKRGNFYNYPVLVRNIVYT